jgi:hypothetical protein
MLYKSKSKTTTKTIESTITYARESGGEEYKKKANKSEVICNDRSNIRL